MPYVRKTVKARHDTKALVDRLEQELRRPKEFGQPVILEDRTPSTKSIRVHVVWDDWQDCPRDLRDQVIFEAYDLSERIPRGERITLAIGLTVPEAAALGLLPIRIVSVRQRRSTRSRERFRKVALKLGGSILRDPSAPELRCATYEQAKTTVDRLQRELPGSEWIIAREIHAGDEY